MAPMKTELTMLTEMMDPDLEKAIAGLKELGITWLDLKGGVLGQAVQDLTPAQAGQVAALLERTGTRTYCLSYTLGAWNVSELDEAGFRQRLDAGLDRLLPVAGRLRPRFVRLLACHFEHRAGYADANEWLEANVPWVYGAYRDAVRRIQAAGFAATIENEPWSIFSHPGETAGFYERLGADLGAGFTWDVQNMWACGEFPSLESYAVMKPWINYVHLKGGKAAPEAPRVMAFRALLEDAGWPVREIVDQVIADGTSPVLCLNCSHGGMPAGYLLAHL